MTTHRDPSTRRLFTMASGGWALVLSGGVVIAFALWALWAPLTRSFNRPLGDGVHPESYGFDLGNFTLPRAGLAAGMLYRDMVPVMDDPVILTAADVQRINDEERGKYLVPSDRVVGVDLAGEARAYPISVLTVHEVVNDVLGGVPIAVTYNWLCDSTVVFDRRVGQRTIALGVSGLLHNCNSLFYDRAPDGGESLWQQWTGLAVSGPAVGTAERRLTEIPAALVSWETWTRSHPETTVIARDPAMIKRYKHASPDTYFISDRIPFPVSPMPTSGRLPAKSRVVAVGLGGVWRVYSHRLIAHRAGGSAAGEWTEQVPGGSLHFAYDAASNTVQVRAEPSRPDVRVRHGFWFAVHAAHPDAALVDLDGAE